MAFGPGPLGRPAGFLSRAGSGRKPQADLELGHSRAGRKRPGPGKARARKARAGLRAAQFLRELFNLRRYLNKIGYP